MVQKVLGKGCIDGDGGEGMHDTARPDKNEAQDVVDAAKEYPHRDSTFGCFKEEVINEFLEKDDADAHDVQLAGHI